MKLHTGKWLLLVLVSSLVLAAAYAWLCDRGPVLPVSTTIFSADLIESDFRLRTLTLGGQGGVYGSQGKSLFRVVDSGRKIEMVYTFPDKVTAIHERRDGLMIIATDNDHWDAQQPCRIYSSSDGGLTFNQVMSIEGGSLLWWSVDSDREGRIYLAEYGPQKQGMSKTLWRSEDDGQHWQAIYRAEDKDKVHLHRIAADPYSDDLWLTIGDGSNRLMLRSQDHGENWQQVDRLQSTAVAFNKDSIYWGMDKKGKPGVLRYDRANQDFGAWFDPGDRGNYGGSVYDMIGLPSGDLIVPFMKYPDQAHVATLWRYQPASGWELLMQLASETGKGSGFDTIAGPDKDGWVYVTGYQFRVGSPATPR